jgi:predicted membrane-bound spermidine synthase
LYLLVFVAGIGSVATEITASRLLAPYYGASTVVWANVIGLVLAALALGYWLGGRLADRYPSPRLLGWLVVAAGVLTAAVPFVAQPLLDVTARGLDEVSAGAVVGSFVGALALFAPPVFLLGMVSPFAIRLAIHDPHEAGTVAGRFFALSTAGSLLGVFLPALVTVPLAGTQRTFLGAATLLAIGGALVLGARWLLVAGALAVLVAVPPGAVKAADGLLHEAESRYQFVQVVERGDARYLYLNEGVAVHSVWRRDHVLTGGEWDMFLVVPPLLGRPIRSVAILGNAGATTARAFGVFYPAARVDGVEIDPEVNEVARRFFGAGDNPRLTLHTADARPFLRRTHERYDLIVFDASRQPYVPFYPATREFFRLARERLAPGGILALNVAAVPDDERLARSIAGTAAWELAQVWRWRPLRFNELVLGLTVPRARLDPRGLDPRLRVLGDLLRRDATVERRLGRPWTDDRAPVEWVTDRMILQYGLEGGDLDEDFLPTHP